MPGSVFAISDLHSSYAANRLIVCCEPSRCMCFLASTTTRSRASRSKCRFRQPSLHARHRLRSCELPRKVDALGTFAGRFGFALDRLLLYGKGGTAFANDKYEINSLIASRSNETDTPQAKSTGPGASEYAPGHLKRKSSASRTTPSHRSTTNTTTTTGSGSRTR